MSKRKRRTLYAAGGIGALLALLFFRCPGGLGFGIGTGTDTGESGDPQAENSAATDAATEDDQTPREVPPDQRCQLRLDKTGLTLDGQPTDLDAAVTACEKAGAADLIVTGEANYGFLKATQEALDASGVKVYQR